MRTRDTDVTNKRLIATFNGDNIVAERVDGQLKIYQVGTGDIGTISVQDHSPNARANRTNSEFWRRQRGG